MGRDVTWTRRKYLWGCKRSRNLYWRWVKIGRYLHLLCQCQNRKSDYGSESNQASHEFLRMVQNRTAHHSGNNTHELRVRACHIFDTQACHDLMKNCLPRVFCIHECCLDRVTDAFLCLLHGALCVWLAVRHHATWPHRVRCGLPELSS